MTRINYRYLHFPQATVQQAIWMCARFDLSLRDVEELLAERVYVLAGYDCVIRKPIKVYARLEFEFVTKPFIPILGG